MPNVYLIIAESGELFPSTTTDFEYFRKKKPGTVLKAKISEPRNGKYHRLYFGLLTVALRNQEKYEVFDDFRIECQIKAGHYKEHITLEGEIIYRPLSIAYENLDNDEFIDLYEQVLRVILKFFLKGTDERALHEEIQKYLGFM